jgi:hypothetical protein
MLSIKSWFRLGAINRNPATDDNLVANGLASETYTHNVPYVIQCAFFPDLL